METNKEIASENKEFHWKVDEPAQENEIKTFWKKLRHFYRTGEVIGDQKMDGMSSALLHLMDDVDSEYPYLLNTGGKEEAPIALGDKTALGMLDQLLTAHQKTNRKKFKGRLSELVIGLNDLLQIENHESEVTELKKTFDFADELIAFDKMVEIIPHGATVELSDERLNRLQTVVSALQKGLGYFDKQIATIVTNEGLLKQVNDGTLFKKTQLIEAKKDVFSQTQKLISEQIHSFSELIRAYRIALIEIEDEYQEEVHSEYFEHFTWHRLLQDELNLFHPIVLLVDHAYVYDHLSSFSKLLSSNLPVNIMVLNHDVISTPNDQVSWEDASHQYRQELAALVISHRNVYTFQSGMADPGYLHQGLKNCLEATSPGVCHVSVSHEKILADPLAILHIKASNAGRHFPSLVYDPNFGMHWIDRFDIAGNVQKENKWPLFTLRARTSEDSEAMIDVAFTYADYKAIYPEKVKELMLIPSTYYNEHLVPLNDYLELDEERLYGKIPYIWLIDDQRNLHRAALPNVWVVSCQERSDFYNYLQELAGLHHIGKKGKADAVEAAGQESIEEENSKLNQEHERQIINIQEEAISKAAERLIAALLDDEELQFDVVQENGVVKKEVTTEDPMTQATSKPVETSQEQPESNVDTNPWVESENCTSCNECTDQFPNLFRYNEEKQALIKDASKGTYEELVKAAEKCPAACIHPGMPLNSNEKNLDKLIKRAEKFN